MSEESSAVRPVVCPYCGLLPEPVVLARSNGVRIALSTPDASDCPYSDQEIPVY